MALDLTPEQRATGKMNFEQASGDLARGGRMNSMAVGGTDRRSFLKTTLAAGAVIPVSAAVYFGYHSWKGNKAVKTALIGTGDEGGVLVGDHNPEFNNIVAVCDIRPTNLERIFKGDSGPRKGLNKVYGKSTADKIKKFDNLDALLSDKSLGLEAVVIATPLNTHDVIAKKCMDAGLHVLCEKLMARDISRCKSMIKHAKDKGVLLSIGHQRHYSTLYAQALEMIESGILGDIKHIRALWDRNNSWPYPPISDAEYAKKYHLPSGKPFYIDSWWKEVPLEDAAALPPEKLKSLGFGNPEVYGFDNIAELVRWRCSESTGGGLMAELGSHQLDASSIILGHVRPLAVQGVGGKFFYGKGRNDRQSDDTVFVNFEFPGPNHPKGAKRGNDESDIVVVTFGSTNTNEFESYGEWVMGSKGTMYLEKEADVFLWREKDKTADRKAKAAEAKEKAAGGRDTKVTVTGAGGTAPAMEATSTWGGGAAASTSKAATSGWDSAVRGYRTEMEHFAYCVRMWQERGKDAKVNYDKKDGKLVNADIIPRCHGEVAMADAIIALTANMAMDWRKSKSGQVRIEFEDAWFDSDSPDVPETKHGKKRS